MPSSPTDDDPPRADLAEATKHAIQNADLDALADLSERLWYALPAAFPAELTALLNAIPAAELISRPRLLLLAIQNTLFSGEGPADDSSRRRQLLHTYIAHAGHYTHALARMSNPRDVVAAGMIALIGHRNAGRYDMSERMAERMQHRLAQLAAEHSSASAAPLRGSWLPTQRTLTAILDGRFARAFGFARDAYDLAGVAPHAHFAGKNAAAYASLVAAYIGNRALAVDWLDRHDEGAAVPEPISLLTSAPAHIARALLAIDVFDESTARAALDAVGDPSAGYEIWPFITRARARFDLVFRSPSLGLSRLAEAVFTNTRGEQAPPLTRMLLLRSEAELLLERGDASAVIALADENRDVPLLSIPAARAHLRAGSLPEALRLASLGSLPRDLTQRDSVELLLISAEAQWRRGEYDDAARLFRDAVDLHEVTGDLSAFREISEDARAELSRLSGAADPFATQRPPVHTPPPTRLRLVQLSAREHVVLSELSTGDALDVIAERLMVSINTVKSQLRGLYRKLGASTREEAVFAAYRLGFLRPPGHRRPRGQRQGPRHREGGSDAG